MVSINNSGETSKTETLTFVSVLHEKNIRVEKGYLLLHITPLIKCQWIIKTRGN
jgi:hypothetical protein